MKTPLDYFMMGASSMGLVCIIIIGIIEARNKNRNLPNRDSRGRFAKK